MNIMNNQIIKLVDFMDTEGNLIRVECPGHVKFQPFLKECSKKHKKSPYSISHAYQRFVTVKKKVGKRNRFHKCFVACHPNAKGAESITVGYF